MEPLIETKTAKRLAVHRLYAASVFIAICLIWVATFVAELWFGFFYWFLTQFIRWNLIYRRPFKDRLTQRIKDENEFPGVDVFVCTADPAIEPPMVVINTVLSVMAYDYPPEKLCVYLSDGAASIITFYALFEASHFAKHWIPFCKKLNAEPTSPAAYFASMSDSHKIKEPVNIETIKVMFVANKYNCKLQSNIVLRCQVQLKHKGFSLWGFSRHNHDTILQLLISGKSSDNTDIEGCLLPSLVYLAQEKRPQHPDHFKAGAMNSLIRVSSNISNGQIIHNVDCDMYSNSSSSVKEALCFFLDEKTGPSTAYVQFPQNVYNLTKNDIYYTTFKCSVRSNYMAWMLVEALLMSALGASSGGTFSVGRGSLGIMGVIYGLAENIITGLSVQFRGWRSVYFNPAKKAFLGLGPTVLSQRLMQQKRWAEGDFQIMFSRYSRCRDYGKMTLGLQLGYCYYFFRVVNSIPVLYYSLIPSLNILRSVSLFPKFSSMWSIPFAYVIISRYIHSLAEFLHCNGTVTGWLNYQRMWLYETTSYFFAFINAILKLLGFRDSPFVITAKVSDREVAERYTKELMDFGDSSEPMITILAASALVNLFCLIQSAMKIGTKDGFDEWFWQICLCLCLVLLNIPMYQGLFLREDTGRVPYSVFVKSVVLVSVCLCLNVSV